MKISSGFFKKKKWKAFRSFSSNTNSKFWKIRYNQKYRFQEGLFFSFFGGGVERWFGVENTAPNNGCSLSRYFDIILHNLSFILSTRT